MRPITDDPKPRYATKALLPDGQGTLYGMLYHTVETVLTCISISRSEGEFLQVARADPRRTVDQASWPSHLLQHLTPHFDFPLILLHDWPLQ